VSGNLKMDLSIKFTELEIGLLKQAKRPALNTPEMEFTLGLLGTIFLFPTKGYKVESSYEECLKKARSEGWRNPIEVTDLEIKAYEAGMITERKRVLFILKDISDGRPMRAIDFGHYMQRIKKIKE
jgi:hypothetical protein